MNFPRAKEAALLAGAAASSLILVLTVLSLTMNRGGKTARTAREAGRLGITYEAALRSPGAALGKPVRWCVHLVSGRAFYGSGSSRPIEITNFEKMPRQLYRRQAGDYECRDALLEITGVKTFDHDGAKAVRIVTSFLDYP